MTINFRLPGPTPLPPEVVAALGREMIPHRGPAFRALFRETLEMAKEAHRTTGDVLIWAATGSAGWEVAIVNLLSPGDAVLAAVNGDFGDRFARVAARLGLDPRRVESPWGEPILPGQLERGLAENPEAKAVLLVHNETSTGVTNPLPELAAVARRHGALVVVDAVSSAGALPLEVDTWGLDFVLSGSQKAWMCPPGLLIAAIGSRAWAAYERSRFPKFYWDIGAGKKMAEQGMTPTTPPLSGIFAFHAALRLMREEGFDNVWERHRRLGQLTRGALCEAGLDLLAAKGFESNTVTAVWTTPGVTALDLLDLLRRDYGVEAQGGQGHLTDRVLRLGHMGWVDERAMRDAVAAVAAATHRLTGVVEAAVAPAAIQSSRT
jgi:aspartate aminotransferase-like enzyme